MLHLFCELLVKVHGFSVLHATVTDYWPLYSCTSASVGTCNDAEKGTWNGQCFVASIPGLSLFQLQ
jgi:hypothetical protein